MRPYEVLVLTSSIWFLAKFVRYAFPPLFGTFQRQYGVSPATLGLLFSLLMFVYAGMQFPSGALADRLGAVRVITAGVLVLAVAVLGLAAIQAFPVLVVAMILIGLGTGAHKTVAINLLATAYPTRTGRTLGITDAIGELGGVAAPAAVVAVLSTRFGWPLLFLAIGVASAVLAAIFIQRMPNHLPDPPSLSDFGEADATSVPAVRTYLAVLRDPLIAVFLLVVVAYAFAFNGLVAFLPLFLETAKGFSTSQAGLLYAILFVVSLVQPLTGGLSDRFGRFPLMITTLGLAGCSLASLLYVESLALIAVLVALVGVGGHGFRPIRESHLVDVLPTEVAGGSLGMIRTVMMGAGAVSPAVVGYLAEVTTYAVSFLLLAVVFCLSSVVVGMLAVVGGGARSRDRPPR